MELECDGGPPQWEGVRGNSYHDSDAISRELELELLEAAPRRVAESNCLGGSVGSGVAYGVDAEGFVGGDGVDVDVRFDLADGGDMVAWWVRVEEAGSPPRRMAAAAAGERSGALKARASAA